jgi:FixJ family two-component response regulator
LKTGTLVERLAHLTPREREVMEHVVAGQPNKQIAAELGTCEQTIKVHRGRVMEKMGVAALADLVRAAEKLGLGKHSTAGQIPRSGQPQSRNSHHF